MAKRPLSSLTESSNDWVFDFPVHYFFSKGGEIELGSPFGCEKGGESCLPLQGRLPYDGCGKPIVTDDI